MVERSRFEASGGVDFYKFEGISFATAVKAGFRRLSGSDSFNFPGSWTESLRARTTGRLNAHRSYAERWRDDCSRGLHGRNSPAAHTKGRPVMNAVNSLPSVINTNIPNVPIGRFEPLSVAGSSVAELLQPLDDTNARTCFAKLTTIQPRLQAERLAAERAMEALTAAKAEMRRINALSDSLIDTAVRLGDLFGYEEISDFANQDDAWLFTIEGLVTAFRARGELGKQVADRFTEVLAESRAVTTELNRATAEYARATAAFSAEYRALSAAIAFGRAVLADLGVSVPRVTPKKKAKSPSPSPANTTDVVPAPAPTPLPMPTPTPHVP